MSGPGMGRAIHYLVNNDTCFGGGNRPAEYCSAFVEPFTFSFIIFEKLIFCSTVYACFYEIDRL